MKSRREVPSSALSFIDCICCGFGAVLLLFILTAKSQIIQKEIESKQSIAAVETLEKAIKAAAGKLQSIDEQLETLNIEAEDAEAINLKPLEAEKARLAQAVKDKSADLALLLETESEVTDVVADLERPSADRKYLSGLHLRGPRVVVLLENSGGMLAEDANSALDIIRSGNSKRSEKWLRAKSAVRAVLAAIPKGTKVAVLQMNEETTALSGTLQNPYIDPYNNSELVTMLEKLDALEARGGADLSKAITTIARFKDRPTSLLLISDGLPTAPNPTNKSLSEKDRVRLFKQALSPRPKYPFNTILLPFDGDPSAAGLYWKLGARTNGITLIPNNDWPAQ